MNLKNLIVLTVYVIAIDLISCELFPTIKNKAEDQHKNSYKIVSSGNESQKSGLSSEFNIHLSPCIHHCTCWLNLTSNDCSNTCQFDESSCLKQKFSTCNLDDFSIKYNESGVVETYLCKNREKSKADTGSKLIIILGSAFICIMLITIGYLCMRIYQTRHETGAHEIPISLLMKF